MLKFFTRKRPTPQVPTNGALCIGNLLDHPALREAMSLDAAPPVSSLRISPQIAELPPLVEVRFGRRQLLEVAA